MNQIDLSATGRGKESKNANRRLRREGKLPAVIYGAGRQPEPVAIDGVLFGKLRGKIHSSTVFNLKIEGVANPEQAIIRDIQRDPVSDRPIHIDFMRIQADKPITVEVPVHAVGSPAGVKRGGVLEVALRRIIVRVLPLEVPEVINVDISGMDLGQTIHVSDLKVPEGVEIITPGHDPVFIVNIPKGMDETPRTGPTETETAAAPAAAGTEKK